MRNCIEHVYTLTSVIETRLKLKQDTFACFIDAAKAFDTVNRASLWYKLFSIGVRGKLYKAIQSLYKNVKYSVRINPVLSTGQFDVPNGLKQGCMLSPTLFSIYVNDLALEINNLNIGVDCNGHKISILLYADDVVLIAPTSDALQAMLNKVNNWCNKWRITLNNTKTKVIHFRAKNTQQCKYEFKCGEMKVDYCEK